MAIPESQLVAGARGGQRRPLTSLIWLGLAISIPLHALLIWVLAGIPLDSGVGEGGGHGEVELVLSESAPLEPTPPSTSAGDEKSPDLSTAPAVAAASGSTDLGLPEATGNEEGDEAAVTAGAAGIFAAAGGAGGTGGSGSGAGSGTTFFGVSGRGKTVGYVVDKSGSMGTRGRIHRARSELDRSVSALPDYASICIALFDDDVVTIDPEGGFLKCRDSSIQRVRAWLNQIGPGGGTNPVPAFKYLFSRAQRPDVVFFMSDGEIPTDAAEEILRLNRRGPNTVIHCIAFGQAAATAPLRRIAAETGGTFTVAGMEGQ